MGPSQICGCPFSEPRVFFTIAHIVAGCCRQKTQALMPQNDQFRFVQNGPDFVVKKKSRSYGLKSQSSAQILLFVS